MPLWSVPILVLLFALPARCNRDEDPNVNSRYTVESVEISPRAESRLTQSVRDDIRKLVGAPFRQEEVDRVLSAMRKQLSGYRIAQRMAKGTRPDSVRIVIDVIRLRRDQDIIVPRLAYHSRQNFSFGIDTDWEHAGHVLTAGLITDNDQLLERYSGIRGGYRRIAAGGRFRGGFVVESFRAQWNPAVQTAVDAQTTDAVPGIYRTRLHAQPEVSVEILPGVWLDAGISIQRFQVQFPAARYESSHALISSLRLERQWEASSFRHRFEAGYHLRAATSSLGSDYLFTRHAIDASYRFRAGADRMEVRFLAGALSGRAPLIDRFVLGNTTTLRGYNKYDVAPLGGNRMAHGSLDYRHKPFRVVYDVGSVYDRGGRSRVLHSLAAGLSTGWRRESLSFLIAFPLREGRAEPVFIVGMNF